MYEQQLQHNQVFYPKYWGRLHEPRENHTVSITGMTEFLIIP